MSAPAGQTPEVEALWRFEKLAGYTPPPASLSEVTRTGLRGLLDRFRDETRLADEPSGPEPLATLAPARLAELIPPPPIDLLRDALLAALEPWPSSAAGSPIRLVIHGHPELGAEASAALARSQGWRWIEPPSTRELLEGDRSFLVDRLPSGEEPVVIDRLERWFLRQPRALDAMRELLGALARRRAPTLVSCGSWAYAWLRGALAADTVLIEPFALAAFDAEALALWLGSAKGGALRVREYGGELILSGAPADSQAEHGARSNFLQHLAAEARGNSCVAAELWAQALRGPTAAADEGNGKQPRARADELNAVPWSDWARPSLGRLARPEEVALLHAIVLHGSLSPELLERTLPFAGAVIASALAVFESKGLVELEATDAWRITAAGYPAVRRELIAAGHSGDGL